MEKNEYKPLAERRRPKDLEEFIGQDHLVSSNKIINKIIERGTAFSLILWGEPGSGKTTLARLISKYCKMDSYFLSAISAGVADVRKVIEKAKKNRKEDISTLLFLDEIHRFNKAQQDSVLGSVENGDIVLIGATTENPSFNVISPLLSRTRVLKLQKLSENNLEQILDNAIHNDEIISSSGIEISDTLKKQLISFSNGDARRMLNLFETMFVISDKGKIEDRHLKEAIENSTLYYDRAGDKHYDTISAFIKSLRGSDPDAAVFYLARMILSGEDPVFIARRLVIFASEDIGNAAPGALNLAVSTLTAVQNIGMPEAEIVLSHCTVFLASAPKSNAAYMAIKKAKQAASGSNYEIPMHIRNAPTNLMKNFGYGKGYKYPHDYPGHFVHEVYLPEEIRNQVFYEPTTLGSEKGIWERLRNLWPGRYKK